MPLTPLFFTTDSTDFYGYFFSPSRDDEGCTFFSPSRDEALYEVSSYCLLCSLENQFSVPTKVNPCTA